MKKMLLMAALLIGGTTMNAQEVQGTVTLGAGYANQAFYKLSTDTETDVLGDSWDIAFYRMSSFEFGTRINDHKGIEVYEASIDPADWATIDVTDQTNWVQLYNSDTDWMVGAFDTASYNSANGYPLGYGWGAYNVTTHHIEGMVVFVLKYADDTYRKFMIDDFFGGYTFTYATWDGTAWGADQTYTIANTTNANNIFNYYSLEDDAEATVAPASTDWDLMFTKYTTDLYGDGTMMYNVTGVLHNPSVEVAQNDESTSTDTSNLVYETNINTIGYDWKEFNMTTFTYDVATDMAYYVKYEDGTIYRIVFNTFEGSSTGVVTFNYEDVTSTLDVVGFNNNVSFGVYPNPSYNKQVTVVYNNPQGNAATNKVMVYNLNGALVFEKDMQTSAGLYNSNLNLSALTSGVYILKFQSGDYTETKKLVLK